jgi:hypothetical protein
MGLHKRLCVCVERERERWGSLVHVYHGHGHMEVDAVLIWEESWESKGFFTIEKTADSFLPVMACLRRVSYLAARQQLWCLGVNPS